MASPDFKKGLLPTSTPIHTRGDESGYFSNNRTHRWLCPSSSLKSLNKLSPIKESLPLRFGDISPKITFLEQNEDCSTASKNERNSQDKANAITKETLSVVRAISFDCSIGSFINNNSSLDATELESLLLSSSYTSLTNTEQDDSSDWKRSHYGEIILSPTDKLSLVTTSDRSPPHKKFQESSPRSDFEIKPRALTFTSTRKTDCDVTYSKESESTNKSLSTVNELRENKNVYKNILPREAQMKCIYVNFIEELQMRNCNVIVTKIFQYLPDRSLCNASFVSQLWRNAVLNDSKADVRRKAFLKERRELTTGPHKENQFGERNNGSPREHKSILYDLCNVLPLKVAEKPQNVISNSKTRYECFIEEGKKINDNEILTKCPKCSFPAKSFISDTRCTCTRILCQYTFCTKCLGPYVNPTSPSSFHKCLKFQEERIAEPKIIICSKQSKKNLRRL